MENVLRARQLPPLILDWNGFVGTLGAIAAGYPWAEGTIRDLWQRCAPMPDGAIGTPAERRIVSPAHLGEWLADVLERQGRPLSEQAAIYNQFATQGARH